MQELTVKMHKLPVKMQKLTAKMQELSVNTQALSGFVTFWPSISWRSRWSHVGSTSMSRSGSCCTGHRQYIALHFTPNTLGSLWNLELGWTDAPGHVSLLSFFHSLFPRLSLRSFSVPLPLYRPPAAARPPTLAFACHLELEWTDVRGHVVGRSQLEVHWKREVGVVEHDLFHHLSTTGTMSQQ